MLVFDVSKHLKTATACPFPWPGGSSAAGYSPAAKRMQPLPFGAAIIGRCRSKIDVA
jgi:hypothetical protein